MLVCFHGANVKIIEANLVVFLQKMKFILRDQRGSRDQRDQGIEGSRDRGIEGSRDRGIEGSRIEGSRDRGIEGSNYIRTAVRPCARFTLNLFQKVKYSAQFVLPPRRQSKKFFVTSFASRMEFAKCAEKFACVLFFDIVFCIFPTVITCI